MRVSVLSTLAYVAALAAAAPAAVKRLPVCSIADPEDPFKSSPWHLCMLERQKFCPPSVQDPACTKHNLEWCGKFAILQNIGPSVMMSTRGRGKRC